jgi:DNA-binding NtrC family response regulator
MGKKSKSPNEGRVVIFDDEPGMGQILVKMLGAQGYDTHAFTNPLEGMNALSDLQPDVLLTDVRMPHLNGMEVLRRMHEELPDVVVLVFTAFGTVEGAVEAMSAGALNYVTKPFDQSNLLAQVARAVEHRRMLQENRRLSQRLSDGSDGSRILGESAAIQQVRDMISRAAPTDSSVLITGRSGVGKELVAAEIHRQSGRSRNRFVAINCPSIPPSLIESEMFGHERGAFTGADRSKMGLIELAQGGTLFLDEIAELPVEIQVKLLRVLQEREIQRVGGLKTINVDLRLVAATNRDLDIEMQERRFRQDLFFRINVINIEIPPLKDRREDIPLIAHSFLSRVERDLVRPGLHITDDAIGVLQDYDWPGNVRELENVLERAVVLSRDEEIGMEDLAMDLRRRAMPVQETVLKPTAGEEPADDPGGVSPEQTGRDEILINYREARDHFERRYLLSLIDRAGGNMTRAAKLSGISRRNLYDKLEKVGLAEQVIRKR